MWWILSRRFEKGIGRNKKQVHDHSMGRFLLFLPLLWACGADGTDVKDQAADTGRALPSGDTETESVKVTGCIRGQLRDFNNRAYPNAVIRAVDLNTCSPFDESNTFGDGTFCLENIPVQENVELQTEFVERCTWAHAKQIQVLSKGNCEQPESCFAMEAWFECEGDTISCQ